MRLNSAGLHRAPAALAVLVLLAAGLFPFNAAAQGADARAAHSRLLLLVGDAKFAASVASESSRLVSLEDAAWLQGALATVVKNASHKKALLTEQASLLELLGRYGDAAMAWEAAASTLPGTADAACLVSAAVCHLAAGDGELAAGLATAVGFLSPDSRTARLAALVSGWAALARGERSVAAGAAGSVLAGNDARFTVAALLLGYASTEGAERDRYEQQLAAYANRPEVTSTVSLLLLGGSTRSGDRVREETALPVPVQQAEMSFYQVGAFRDEANARLLVKKLEGLGLEPLLKLKSAKELYIVYVHAGSDSARTVLVLKDAGYEAWAVDGTP
jgi:hypothetical protein